MPTKHKPDTTIPCNICKGTKRNGNHECGACFGTGLSTASYDQRRNATTITVWEGEKMPDMEGLEVHSRRATNRTNGSTVMPKIQHGVIMLISWTNKDYRGE
jgi:hypothetical protein